MRNITIHIVKLVAVVLVIGIHMTEPLKEFGEDFNNFFQQGVARMAVPLFFAISGYYLYANILKKGQNYFEKYVKRVSLIAVVWGGIYLICYVPGLMELDQCIPIKLAKIFWNYLFGYYHLWYLTALIIGSFGIWYTAKNNLLKNNRFLILCGILYLIGCLFNVYGNYIDNDLFIKIKYGVARLLGNAGRNGFFYGFPMMIVGALAYKFSIKNTAKIRIGLIVSLLILLSDMALFCFKQVVDMYISMPLFAYFLVSYLITDPLRQCFKNISDFLIGIDLSLGMYLIHLLVIKQVMPNLNIPNGILEYMAVVIISFSFIFVSKKVFKNTPVVNYF